MTDTVNEHQEGWTRTASDFNLCRQRDEEWERDRQVILSQLHNLLLALRSNTRFTTRLGSQRGSASPLAIHPLTLGVKDLRERLFYPSASAGPDDFTADQLLRPFCDVILSEETTEPITGVALAAFVAFLDLKCAFLTPEALVLMSETAKGSRSEIADAQSHEAVLARILQVYVGCARHPSAEMMGDKQVVAMLKGAYTVAAHGEPSELLRRTAEQGMNEIVTAVFERILSKISGLPKHVRIMSIASNSNLLAEGTNHQQDHLGDGQAILEYICTLISSPSTAADTHQVSTAAVQLQGLCLAHTVLFLLKDELAKAPTLLHSVRNNLCRALLRVGSNCTNVIVLSQLLRTAHLVVQFAAIDVVPQALSIIDQLHLEPLQRLLAPSSKMPPPMTPNSNVSSPRTGVPQNQYLIDSDFSSNEAHEMLMESFLEFCANASFPTFCYAHYDLNLEYKGLLEMVCKFVAQCVTQSVIGATGTAPAAALFNPTTSDDEVLNAPYALASVRWAEVGVLALDGLTAMVRTLHQRVTHADYADAKKAAEGHQLINELLTKKKRLKDFSELFDAEEFKKAVKFILTPPEGSDSKPQVGQHEGVTLDCFGLGQGSSGWDLGEFLFKHKSALDRTALGNFLGELGKESQKPAPADDPDGTLGAQWEEDRRDDYKVAMSVRFFQQVLKGFLNCFNCKGKPLLRSIREVMYQMKLPGESQKIDRVMETFANHWYSVNKDAGPEVNPFQAVDGAFILAFSIIMLNTDIHSGKMIKVMSKPEFKSMNRGIDAGNNLPDAYLDEIYDDVRANQIVMIDMIKQGYSNDSVWTLEIMEAKSHAAHDLPIGLRSNTLQQLAALDPFVLDIMWRPAVTSLLSVLTNVCAACDGVGSPLLSRNINSMRAMWHALKVESKKSYEVIRASFEGILRCAETSHILQNVAALDYIVTSLGQLVIPAFQQWFQSGEPNNYRRAGRSVVVLVSLHLLMKVVDRFGSTMEDGWRTYCEVWKLVLLCGVFSDDGSLNDRSISAQPNSSISVNATVNPSEGSVTTNEASSVTTNAPQLTPSLRPILRQSPLTQSKRLRKAVASTASQGGGWFSGFWGGNNQMLIDEQRREREAEDLAALSRLRSSVPSLSEMLQIQFTDVGLKRMLQTLCFLGELKPHTSDSGAISVDPVKAFASSYLAQLVVEVTVFDIRRVDFNDTHVFAFLRSLMHISFAVLRQLGPNPKDADELAFWKSITDRVVDAVMTLIVALSKSEETREALFLLLSDLTALPEPVFKLVIAEPLGRLLSTLLMPPHVADDHPPDSPTRHPLRTCTRDGWARLIGAARMVAVRAPSQQVRMLAVHVLVLMAREASVGGWATMGHLQSLAMAIAEVLGLDPVQGMADGFDVIRLDANHFTVAIEDGRIEAAGEQAPEALYMLHKTIVSSKHMQTQRKEDSGEWTRAWLTCIGALATVAASVPNDKIAGDALLATQRCILDDRLLLLDAKQIVELFHAVLLPLMETICNTSIAAEKAVVAKPGAGASQAGNGPAVASYLLPSVLISAVFGPMAGPARGKKEAAPLATAEDALSPTHEATPAQPVAQKATQKMAMARSDDIQCRCIAIVPKALLHFTNTLAASPAFVMADGMPQAPMTALWKEVIGTLYALYSSGSVDSVLLDAIKENIRNVVLVLAALFERDPSGKNETAKLFEQTNPQFWTITKALIRPFSFAEPLLQYIDERNLK